MKAELEQRFGAHRVAEVPVNEGEIPLLALDLDLASEVTVIVTNGLSNYKMPVPEPEVGNEYNELFFCLPGYWEWEDVDNPNTNWIFYWIQRLAKYVVENETWFGHGHTMPCGKDMQPLSETMKENHFILLRPMFLSEALAPINVNGKNVQFLAIVPIFGEEMDYKQGRGTNKFIQKMINKGVNEILDDFRGSVLKRNWIFRR